MPNLDQSPPAADLKPANAIRYSVVLPVYNERENLRRLIGELSAVMGRLGGGHEMVCVDDASRDGSDRELALLAQQYPGVRAVRHRTNCGQSAALATGFGLARGEVVITLDADGQNDPADIPAMLARLTPDVDAVTGVRERRQDSWIRRASSGLANRFRNAVTGDAIRDAGCAMRVIRRAALREIPCFNGMHRFLPTLLRMQGYTVVEMPVGHRPRLAGVSKYGVGNRLWRGLADCFAIRWMKMRAFPGRRAAPLAMDGESPGLETQPVQSSLEPLGGGPPAFGPRQWLGLGVAALCVLVVWISPLREWMAEMGGLRERVQGMGAAAPAVFMASVALLVAMGVPRTVFFPLGGIAFGFGLGLAYTMAATLAGAYATFCFARWAGRDYALRRWPALRSAFGKVAARDVLGIVALRQLPAPGFLTNVLLGLMPVAHFSFLLGTFLGALPLAAAACLAGSGLVESAPQVRYAMLGASGVLWIGVAGVFGRLLVRSDRYAELKAMLVQMRRARCGRAAV